MIQRLAKEIADDILAEGFVRLAMEQGWDESDYELTVDDCDFVREELDGCTQSDLVDVQQEVRRVIADAIHAETLRKQMQEAEDIHNEMWGR
jgi:hypothetical protein